MTRMIMKLVQHKKGLSLPPMMANLADYELENSVPQRLVLVSFFFTTYIYHLPSTTFFMKFAYADSLAIIHSSAQWKGLEGILNQTRTIFSAYLQYCRSKLSHIKTVTATFHICNQVVMRELNV